MKKLINTKIIFLIIALVCGFSQAGAQTVKNIYVSHTQAGSGDGSESNPYSMADFHTKIVNASTVPSESTINVFFERGGLYTTGHFSLNGYGFDRSVWHNKNVTFNEYGTAKSPVVFNGASNVFVSFTATRSDSNRFSLTIRNIILQNFSDNTNGNKFIDIDNSNTLILDNVTIRNCNNSHADARLLHIRSSRAQLTISNSSIINNNRSSVNLMYIQTASIANIYNNTFSNNTCNQIFIASSATKFFNNTVYNSGTVMLGNAITFINNLILGTSIYSAYENNASYYANCYRNTQPYQGKIYFNATANSGGVDITSAIAEQFNTRLTDLDEPGKQVHALMGYSNTSHVILGKGGTMNALSSSVGISLTTDQLGELRTDPISLGSLSTPLFVTSEYTMSSLYNSTKGETPSSVPYDLSLSVLEYPTNVNKTDLLFTIDQSTLDNGFIDQQSAGSPIVTFNPGNHENKTSYFKVIVSSNNTLYKDTITVKTFVYDIGTYQHPSPIPPGYVKTEDFPQTCFDFMGKVTFSSKILFSTNNVNTSAPLHYGFSIPLVGDLNGDGYPEIISIKSGADHGEASYTGIVIYNGLTGKVISNINWPSPGGTYTSYSSHSSPSILALVDSDRDGTVELIVAFPNAGETLYRHRVVSFNINYNNGNYSLSRRWISHSGTSTNYVNYTDKTTAGNNFSKPIPQVVDLDGDGIPEIVVYNRIFNAITGELLLTIDPGSAFVGYDANARLGDCYINFSYIYDMDFDGIYDVVAGGKVYKITKNSSGQFEYKTYQVRDDNNALVPDGRTGVADINGDGIPDVVAVMKTSNTQIRIVVWNPNFYIIENGNIIENPSTPVPEVLADVKYTVGTGASTGSSSYVYIGDIDGNEQVVNGKTYRLPEIAILSGNLTYSTVKTFPGKTFPTSGSSGRRGDIVAFTWDAQDNIPKAERLKVSFVLEHDDSSINTGFTMFDFDNDGMMEICYRDEATLRIIKCNTSYVSLNESSSNIILFQENVKSYTGYEYPVIADINNDASAEMIVTGHPTRSTGQYQNYIYAVGYDKEDKFAPAWPVWNQFMYDPFKIKPDSLTTPVGKAPNRLNYSFKRVLDKGSENERTINFNPFNGTLAQATKFMMAEDLSYGHIYDPIVFLTEAYLVDNKDVDLNKRPALTAISGGVKISVTIGNKESALTDVAINTPIAIYKNGIVSQENYITTKLLSDFVYDGTSTKVDAVIKANSEGTKDEEQRISISLTTAQGGDANGVYILRLGDNSGYNTNNVWEWKYGLNSETSGQPNPSQGIGIASRQFRDCYWGDQSVIAAKLNIFPDAVTVQAYKEIKIAVFDNDILPDTYFASLNMTSGAMNSFEIITPPKAGNAVISGTGQNLKVIYQNTSTDKLTHSVDSFIYKTIFDDITLNPTRQERTTTAYIYILQSSTGFATCDNSHTIQLKDLPQGNIDFLWYKDGIYLQTNPVRQINNMGADSTYIIEPRISSSFSARNYRNITFPEGEMVVHKNNSGIVSTMKWTGFASSDWYNPNNWVEIKGNNEFPVISTPTSCVNIIIPTGASYYPELTTPASCANIHMEDRAMLSGIWYLTYDSASVDITLTPKEKDRFVMWSAPLKETYTGDYHYKKPNTDDPAWGDVYMNFFQLENPDYPGAGSVAQRKNTFTATFGNIWTPLPLGTAFNLNVTSTSQNSSKTFSFPQRQHKKYKDINGNWSLNNPNESSATPLARDNSHRFITDDIVQVDSIMYMPLNDEVGNEFIQLVNPYMAYLDMLLFPTITHNSTSNNMYISDIRIWKGYTGESFISIVPDADIENGEGRYIIKTDEWERDPLLTFVPPLQSFIVKKRLPDYDYSAYQWIKFTPSMFTTKAALGKYELRSETSEIGVLRVRAIQGNLKSNTALYYDPVASPSYTTGEDALKLFYDEFELDIYSLTSRKEPLSINTSNSFTEVPLGLRLKNPGMVTLEFKGMNRFGHNVYLVDKELKGKDQITDLQTTSSYTFTAVKPSGSTGGAFEINDRFVLRMEYTGIANESVGPEEDLHVSSKDGYIEIQSSALVSGLQVYNINGALVYNTNSQSNFYRIPVEGIQTYIVKVKCRGKYEVRKVFVK